VIQPTIKQGSKGPAVQLAQVRLAAKGFYAEAPDGKFGTATDLAVERFQAASGVPADGIVGPVTWSLLMVDRRVSTPESVLQQRKDELISCVAPGTPSKVMDVLRVAIDMMGRKEVPAGSNGGPDLVEIVGGDGHPPSAYWKYAGITDPKTLSTMPPWCVLFVSYALRTGLHATRWRDIPFGRWMASSSAVEEWAKDAGVWRTGGMPPSGAIFTVGSKAAVHTALAVGPSAGRVATIEGNVNNAVGSLERSPDSIRGYAVWW
jgi:hypothetical protein